MPNVCIIYIHSKNKASILLNFTQIHDSNTLFHAVLLPYIKFKLCANTLKYQA